MRKLPVVYKINRTHVELFLQEMLDDLKNGMWTLGAKVVTELFVVAGV